MSTISPLVHALAGSIGSALSLWLMYPLERVRIEMQTGIDKTETNKRYPIVLVGWMTHHLHLI